MLRSAAIILISVMNSCPSAMFRAQRAKLVVVRGDKAESDERQKFKIEEYY